MAIEIFKVKHNIGPTLLSKFYSISNKTYDVVQNLKTSYRYSTLWKYSLGLFWKYNLGPITSKIGDNK